MTRTLNCMLLVIVLINIVGCEDGTPTLPEATPGPGFVLETLYELNLEIPFPVGPVAIQGDWQSDLAGATGDASQISGSSLANPPGLLELVNKRAPAIWEWTWKSGFDSECDGVTATGAAYPTGTFGFICQVITGGVDTYLGDPFSFSPDPIDAVSPPSTATITGSGFDATYAEPLVQYYALDGTLVDEENATSISGGGTTLTGSVSSIAELPAGTYVGFINNKDSGGNWNYAGTTAVLVVTPNVTFDGYEQNNFYDACPGSDDGPCWTTEWDGGTPWITINSVTYSTYYDYDHQEPASFASDLASAINADSSAPVTAWVSGATVYLTGKSSSSYSSLSLTAGVTEGNPYDFPYGSAYFATVSGD